MNFVFEIDTCKRADGGFLSYGRGALRAIAYPGPGDECAAFPIPAAPRLPYALVNTGNDTRAIQAWMWHKNIEHTCAIPSWRRNGLRILAAEASCDGLEYGSSRNSNVIDEESKRLKQVELSGPRRERVSLDTYADTLAAREAEFRQEAKYCTWSEPASNVLR